MARNKCLVRVFTNYNVKFEPDVIKIYDSAMENSLKPQVIRAIVKNMDTRSNHLTLGRADCQIQVSK